MRSIMPGDFLEKNEKDADNPICTFTKKKCNNLQEICVWQIKLIKVKNVMPFESGKNNNTLGSVCFL